MSNLTSIGRISMEIIREAEDKNKQAKRGFTIERQTSEGSMLNTQMLNTSSVKNLIGFQKKLGKQQRPQSALSITMNQTRTSSLSRD